MRVFWRWRWRRRLLVLALLASVAGQPLRHALARVASVSVPAHCGARDGGTLPDRRCTPGAVQAGITRADLCPYAHTQRWRPPVDYTQALKRRQVAAYGYADRRLSHYEEDHLVPLELGGDPRSPGNLWPEPHSSSYDKDRVENALHAAVCSGRVGLAHAQRAITRDWIRAGRLR